MQASPSSAISDYQPRAGSSSELRLSQLVQILLHVRSGYKCTLCTESRVQMTEIKFSPTKTRKNKKTHKTIIYHHVRRKKIYDLSNYRRAVKHCLRLDSHYWRMSKRAIPSEAQEGIRLHQLLSELTPYRVLWLCRPVHTNSQSRWSLIAVTLGVQMSVRFSCVLLLYKSALLLTDSPITEKIHHSSKLSGV
jgi:hypothetical protein